MSTRQLILLALIVTCIFWGYNLDNQIILDIGRSLSAILVFRYTKEGKNPLTQRLSLINSQYITLALTIVLLWNIMNIAGGGIFEQQMIIRLVAWIASINTNQTLLKHNVISFGKTVLDTESMIMIASLLIGSRIIYTYRYTNSTMLYIFATGITWMTVTVLHLLSHHDHKRLRSWPFFSLISILFVCSMIWGLGTAAMNIYSETALAKAKIQDAKPLLPMRFSPQLGPRLMSEDTK